MLPSSIQHQLNNSLTELYLTSPSLLILTTVFLDRLDLISNICQMIIFSNFYNEPVIHDLKVKINKILISKDRKFVLAVKQFFKISKAEKDYVLTLNMKDHLENTALDLEHNLSANVTNLLHFKIEKNICYCPYNEIPKMLKTSKVKASNFALQIEYEFILGKLSIQKRMMCLNPNETILIMPDIKDIQFFLNN